MYSGWMPAKMLLSYFVATELVLSTETLLRGDAELHPTARNGPEGAIPQAAGGAGERTPARQALESGKWRPCDRQARKGRTRSSGAHQDSGMSPGAEMRILWELLGSRAGQNQRPSQVARLLPHTAFLP